MADMLKFYKGQLGNLPEVGAVGAIYITEDEGGIYLGTGAGMKRLGDFVQVASVSALPEHGAHESALYYCVAENILAKWNGSSWSQINKDTGMTSVEVAGEGNAVTAAEYNAETRKLTLTKGATYATPAVVDSKIATAVGALGNDAEGNAYADVKAYVDAKTAGIATDAALGELQGKVEANEDAIEDLQTWVGGKSVDGQIDDKINALNLATTYEAKGAAKAVQDDLDAYKETNDAAVAAAKKAGDDAQSAVDALAGKVGEVPEGKTVAQMISDAQTAATYDDTAVRGLISDNAAAIDAIEDDYLKAADKTELQGKIDLKADKSVVDGIVADYLKAADKTALEGKITAEENARKAADEALDARLVEVETFFATAEGETLNTALDTLVEIQKYITDEGSAADEMVKDISANAEAIADLEEEIGAPAEGETAATGLYKVIADADKALSDRIDGIHDHENLAVLNGITAEKVADWDGAKAHANSLNSAMNTRVEALEAIDHEHANKALLDTYTQTEANLADAVAKKHEHGNKTVLDGITAEKVAAWDAAEANAKAYADQAEADAIAAAATDAANKDAVVLAEAQKGIGAVQSALDTHTGNGDIHITAAERTAWSAAEQNAKDYAKGLSDSLTEQLQWGSF